MRRPMEADLFMGNQFNFHLSAFGKGSDLHTGTGGRTLGKAGGVDLVDLIEVCKVSQKHCGLYHMTKGEPSCCQNGLQIFQHLFCLDFNRITGLGSSFRNQRNLAGGEQKIAGPYGMGIRTQGGRGMFCFYSCIH